MSETVQRGSRNLIVTIVQKGAANSVLEATHKAGVEGGTVIMGEGTADKNRYLDFFGLEYNPEKDVILTIAQEQLTDKVFEAIVQGTKLDKPGQGISFIIDLNNLPVEV